MGFKPVTINQDGDDVLVGFLPEEMDSISNATLQNFVVEDQDVCEPDTTLRSFIDQNPKKNLNLHKVLNDEIVCRTPEKLAVSTFLEWEYDWDAAIADASADAGTGD